MKDFYENMISLAFLSIAIALGIALYDLIKYLIS